MRPSPFALGYFFSAAWILAQAVYPSSAFCQVETVDTPAKVVWTPLKDHWESCNFGGDGPITKTDERMRFGIGDPLTGVRWTGDKLPAQYEIQLQARRVEGFDFFCAVTFPVGDEHCSLVLGGWGGGVLGISSIDGGDASSNETTQYKEFENGKWYAIRVRVTNEKIQCFIDGDDWVDVDRGDHTFDIRLEMDPALPLGLANYQCVSELKQIEFRSLDKSAPEASDE